MAVTFNCPECGSTIRGVAGKAGRCPACRASVRAPGDTAPVQEKPAAVLVRAKGSKGFGAGLLAGLLIAVVTMVGLIVVVFFGGVMPAWNKESPAPGWQAVAADEQKPDPSNNDDPVEAIKALARNIGQGTEEKVKEISSKSMNGWGLFREMRAFGYPEAFFKRRFTASIIGFDVRKTDSIVSPLLGTVTWTSNGLYAGPFRTRIEAQAAELTDENNLAPAKLVFGWQNKRWNLAGIENIHLKAFAIRSNEDWIEVMTMTPAQREASRKAASEATAEAQRVLRRK